MDSIITDDGKSFNLSNIAGTYTKPASDYESKAIIKLGSEGSYKKTQFYYDEIIGITRGYYYL